MGQVNRQKARDMIYNMILLFGFMLIFIGLHNIDNARNLYWVNCNFDSDITEHDTLGKSYSQDTLYAFSMDFCIIGTCILILLFMTRGRT